MTAYHHKYVSILGDSISTFLGYTPEDGVFYDPNYAQNTGVASVNDTWWMKTIQGIGGALLVNNSYAGSTICRDGYQAACAPWRIRRLQKDGIDPDYIFIYSGLNDVAFYRSPEAFWEDYGTMLQHMEEMYPNADVWCGTLCRGFLKVPDWPLFVNLDACKPLSQYNDAIRHAVSDHYGHLADLAAFEQRYSSLDGVHPNREGMELLAQMWLRCILT